MSAPKAHLEVLPRSVQLVLGLGLLALAAFPFVGSEPTYEIPGDIREIGEFAFAYCKDLFTLTIPANVEIADNAFYRNEAIEAVTLPEGLTVAEGARDSLDEALLAAETLPAASATLLTALARSAFDQAFGVVLVVVAALLLGVSAAIVWAVGRVAEPCDALPLR